MRSDPRVVGAQTLLLVVASVTLAACTSATPTAPDRAPAGTPTVSPALSPSVSGWAPRSGAQVALQNGQFTLATAGGTMSGTYTGVASVSSQGRTSATLDLEVTGGTNSYLGASGNLSGDGSGGFVGEGSFALNIRGTIATAADPVTRIKASLTGTSVLSCSNGMILVTLTGDGSAQKVGDAHAVLSHVITNAGCGP